FGGGGGRGFGGGGPGRSAPPTLRQSIAENVSYSHNAGSTQNFSPLLGGSSESDGYNVSSSYTVGYGRLNSTATVGWNRSRAKAANYFTNGSSNPAVAAGIDVATPTIYTNSFYFGVPTVALTGYSGLGDSTPSDTVNQTVTLSDMVSWSHKRHNTRYGIDFHRIHADSIGGTNVLGSFTFSGFATENPAAQTCPGCTNLAPSGSSIADLLIGQPQQTQVTAGLNKVYLRANSWDWYAQDDWRARSNLTLMAGLRWEYFSPYTEKSGRLVNLNVSGSGPGIQITNVCATSATGCQQVSPGTLVSPDKAMYSPRIGLAWQPKFKWTKNTVVRSGYGINYNTGQYATFARRLASQQPFAVTQTNTLSSGSNPNTGCTLANMTLTNGFGCSTQLVQSNFGVNPFYRDGLVQVYNLGVQRTLPRGIVLNVDYNGSYAGNLDILRAPNRTPTGVANGQVTQFTYEDSLGYQRSNALAINLRQRMRKGIGLQATYTYSHSIDDASSVGGSGSSIAQNDQNLGAEESNSSFDVRHSLSGSFVMELPFGPNRAFLNKGGVWSRVLDGYSVSGNYTFASGGWATPVYSGTTTEIAAGAGNSLRPDRVPGQRIAGAGTLTSWFNTAAFAAPAAGTYGNASRNSIELPGTVAVNGVLSRNFSFGETRSLEARIQANNVFNTVQYSGVYTVINSANFGQVSSAAAMRALVYTARFRF
ncbi:MAG: carboxypeptidase regulatory-like domain-containing protein, partial [Acidobacteriota bacterium]|nr:carboxypeptidase regulatory-like domain-containing protein [Acidobacteriota bacterium]